MLICIFSGKNIFFQSFFSTLIFLLTEIYMSLTITYLQSKDTH